jgi:hypothetical protein
VTDEMRGFGHGLQASSIEQGTVAENEAELEAPDRCFGAAFGQVDRE